MNSLPILDWNDPCEQFLPVKKNKDFFNNTFTFKNNLIQKHIKEIKFYLKDYFKNKNLCFNVYLAK